MRHTPKPTTSVSATYTAQNSGKGAILPVTLGDLLPKPGHSGVFDLLTQLESGKHKSMLGLFFRELKKEEAAWRAYEQVRPLPLAFLECIRLIVEGPHTQTVSKRKFAAITFNVPELMCDLAKQLRRFNDSAQGPAFQEVLREIGPLLAPIVPRAADWHSLLPDLPVTLEKLALLMNTSFLQTPLMKPPDAKLVSSRAIAWAYLYLETLMPSAYSVENAFLGFVTAYEHAADSTRERTTPNFVRSRVKRFRTEHEREFRFIQHHVETKGMPDLPAMYTHLYLFKFPKLK